MIKTCTICGKEFESPRKNKTCSPECAHQRNKDNQAIWRAKHRILRRQKEAEQKTTYTIRKVLDMAEAHGVTYGRMVQLLENGLQTVSGKEKAVGMG